MAGTVTSRSRKTQNLLNTLTEQTRLYIISGHGSHYIRSNECGAMYLSVDPLRGGRSRRGSVNLTGGKDTLDLGLAVTRTMSRGESLAKSTVFC